MSRYHGNHEQCVHCGQTYGEFRSGFRYRDIVDMLWDFSPDRSEWKYKRRGTVLGMWHQLKRTLWQRHKEEECHAVPATAVGAAPF